MSQQPSSSSQQPLAGAVTFITGASGNIGTAFARAFAAAGARLFLTDIAAAGLERVQADVLAQLPGAELATHVLDVTDPAQVEAAMAACEARFGSLDVLLNNAGLHSSAPLLEHRLDEWQRILRVNVDGVFICTQAALKRMVPRKAGRIINLSSIAGRQGSNVQAAYNTSKHAVIGLTRCTALEMGPHGITANALCPGLIESDMFNGVLRGMAQRTEHKDPERQRQDMLRLVPQGRMIQPEEVAAVAVFLAGPAAGAITGQAIPVDGGRVMA